MMEACFDDWVAMAALAMKCRVGEFGDRHITADWGGHQKKTAIFPGRNSRYEQRGHI